MINIVILGVSCLEGMAGTRRVRNLIDPLLEKNLITAHNLIYRTDAMGRTKQEGHEQGFSFKVIGFSAANIFSLFRFQYSGMRFLWRARSKREKNILYHYDAPDIKNILFILFAKLIGYKVVFDIIEDHRFAPAYKSLLYRFRTWTSVFFLNNIRFLAAAVIVISEHLHRRLQAVTGNKVPLVLIPISVNLKNFQDTPRKAASGDLKIFYGGSFGEKDGLGFLIKAFDKVCTKHANANLILTGMGNDVQQRKFSEMVSQTTHAHRIHHKGYLSATEYYHVLNDCDIFCMTRNNSEFANAGFPFKLGEFLAVGKAVIATNVGDVPLYLKDGHNAILVPPESVDDLAEALTEILSDTDKIQRIGAEGRKTAQKYFDSDVLSTKLYEVFKGL